MNLLHGLKHPIVLLFVFLSGFLLITFPALADVNSSGFQISAYGGITNTNIDPGALYFGNEVDSLNPFGNEKNKINATGGVGVAYRFITTGNKQDYVFHDISAGIDLYYFEAVQHGEVWQFEDPNFANFKYNIPISSGRMMFDSEWTFHPIGKRLFPFFEMGIGVARNSVRYSDVTISNDYSGDTTLYRHTKNQFAYGGGLGLKYLVSPHLNVSLRYLYTNLGNAETSQYGYNEGNVTLAAPVTVHLYTQSWLFGLSYFK